MTDGFILLSDAENLWLDVLAHVDDEAYAEPSGCEAWNTRELVNHVTGGGHRYAMLLDGASAADTFATREVDYVGGDPVAEFRRYETSFRAALGTADGLFGPAATAKPDDPHDRLLAFTERA